MSDGIKGALFAAIVVIGAWAFVGLLIRPEHFGLG